jgi:hypothetical protein
MKEECVISYTRENRGNRDKCFLISGAPMMKAAMTADTNINTPLQRRSES